MECPICGATARVIRAPAFDGRRFNCQRCGDYDVSGTVLERKLLERLNKVERRDVLERARINTPRSVRPIITSYLI